MTYPSGRIVIYTRDTTGRITGVTTKLNAGAAVVNVATAITYQPISNLIKSLTPDRFSARLAPRSGAGSTATP